MKNKLKPCPFCGSAAHQYGGGVSQELEKVICLSCGAGLTGNYEQWNSRPIEEDLEDELKEALDELRDTE